MLKGITKKFSTLALFGLIPAALAIGQEISVKQLQLEKEGTKLISQMEDVARDINYNADQLDALSHRPQLSKWTHYHHLHQIKELVNDGLRPALTRLVEIQPELPSWKQDVIDQMLSSAKALAADTNSAIIERNESKNTPLVLNAEYRELISRINSHAQTLLKTSDAAADVAMAHLKANEAGLEFTTR